MVTTAEINEAIVRDYLEKLKAESGYIMTSIGEAIRSCRRRRGLSQRDLSALSTVDRAYISSLECGKRNVSIETLCRIAIALNISFVDLLPVCRDGEWEVV